MPRYKQHSLTRLDRTARHVTLVYGLAFAQSSVCRLRPYTTDPPYDKQTSRHACMCMWMHRQQPATPSGCKFQPLARTMKPYRLRTRFPAWPQKITKNKTAQRPSPRSVQQSNHVSCSRRPPPRCSTHTLITCSKLAAPVRRSAPFRGWARCHSRRLDAAPRLLCPALASPAPYQGRYWAR